MRTIFGLLNVDALIALSERQLARRLRLSCTRSRSGACRIVYIPVACWRKDMSAATVLGQFLDPLSRCLDTESARCALALDVPAAVQARVDALAELANEGLLTDDERGI
jgi:hypothetical protein